MDRCPSEVLQVICSNLSFEDVATVRLLTRKLADVGAQFALDRVRFHTSEASLERLEHIAQHPILSKTVKVLVYEAALLANVESRKEYRRHWNQAHHLMEKPEKPPASCSAREQRLYARNKLKWNQDINAKYDRYRGLFDSQNALLDNDTVELVLSRCVPRFTKLTSIGIDPVRRCPHVASQRFIEEFGSGCSTPLSGNFSTLSKQFEWTFLPSHQALESLRKLEVNSLSPSFFKPTMKALLCSAFRNLKNVDITLKLAERDIDRGEHRQDCFHRHLSNGVFKDALSSAINLERVSIGIESALPFWVDMSHIFPIQTWPLLRSLSMNTISSTQEELMKLLRCQPMLKVLEVTAMKLDQGSWPETLTEMRDNLDLEMFMPMGFIEDSSDSWSMDLIHVPFFIDDHEEYDLASAIDLYVTTNSSDDIDSDGFSDNPLDDISDFDDPHIVREMFGSLSDLDSDEFDDGMYRHINPVSMLGTSNIDRISAPTSGSDASMTDLE